MKKVLTDNISSGVRKQRFTKASLDHLMSAYQECFSAILLSLNCNPAEVTDLTGVSKQSSTQGSEEINAGWVAYQGELFQVDQASVVISDTAVWKIVETYSANDPTKFDDGNEFNVNVIRKITIENGASGSGLADYDEFTIITLADNLKTLLGI